ncbi:MAG: adenylosuccinate lyase [Bacteroidota bacterium]
MDLNQLTAISPLDGRYRKKIDTLTPYFSEYGLIHYRVFIEVEYLIAIHETGVRPLRPLGEADKIALRRIFDQFGESDADQVKAFERQTNHDVKAVEYYLKAKLAEIGVSQQLMDQLEFIHFGLTSQDINNTAIPLSLKDAIQKAYLPQIRQVISTLESYAKEWAEIPLLARTHGQPASPTRLGKEFAVFVARLEQQVSELAQMPFPAKFGGATGNLNAHYIAYPDHDWHGFADAFVSHLGLARSYPTTQIEHYDGLARIFDCLKRINTILIDLCQDIWIYISQEYFRQKVKAGEVGSSAMPHKVNPIDFENAEGNAGLSTAVLEFLSRKLPVSRLQRDLTDSTVLRNLGVAMGYAMLSISSVQRGLGKLLVNKEAIAADLDKNWAVLAEAIQTILRREGYPKPYEALRDLTRGNNEINEATLTNFIRNLNVNEAVKTELLMLRPRTYTGK